MLGNAIGNAILFLKRFSLTYTFESTWKTDNAGTSNDDQISLPLEAGGTYDFNVQWGDGSDDDITVWNQAEVTHTYSAAGTYTVKITGTINGWRFFDGGDKLKLLTVESWGELLLGSLGNYFHGCANLVVNATDELDVSGVITMGYAFHGCSSMVSLVTSNWDVSGVISFWSCFKGCSSLITIDTTNWNVGNVINFGDFLQDCSSFTIIDVSNWDVSSVDEFEYAFKGCAILVFDAANWNTSSVIDFNYCFGFNDFTFIAADQWDISLVTNMTYMFRLMTLTVACYDAILISWAAQEVQTGVVFDAGNSKYTGGGDAAAAKAHLVDVHGWVITDGGVA